MISARPFFSHLVHAANHFYAAPCFLAPQIFDFFRGYYYVESSMRLDAMDSRSSGTATIDFETPKDAKRAVRDLHRKYIGKRYIELSLV